MISKRFAFVLVALSLTGQAAFAGFDFEACAKELTILAQQAVVGEMISPPWLGGNPHTDRIRPGRPEYGWTVTEAKNIPSMLRLAGVPAKDAEGLIESILSFEMNGDDRYLAGRDPDRNQAASALIASYAIGSFLRLPERSLIEKSFYVTVLPKGRKLRDGRLATLEYEPANFGLIDFWAPPEKAGLALSSKGPVRKQSALILTYPDFKTPEDRAQWVADVVRALSLYSDLNLIYTWMFSNRLLANNNQPTDEWFDLHVDITADDFMLLESSFFTLLLGARADAAHAYARSRMLKLPFQPELTTAMARTIADAKKVADPEAIDNMDMQPENLFQDLATTIDEDMRKTIDRARPFRGRTFRP